MSQIISLPDIKRILPTLDLLPAIETGFVAYSENRCVVPPVGELLFEQPPGDVHIKYGYIKGDDFYVVKIASGFYNNPSKGLPSNNGMMLLFDARTGEPVAVLLDEAYLTDIRTGLAGAVAAKHLAPSRVDRIGILGTGTQAHVQLDCLAPLIDCRDLLIFGRSERAVDSLRQHYEAQGYRVAVAHTPDELLDTCDLIVTTTASTHALLDLENYSGRGMHITAVGSDTRHKQELTARSLARADVLVADSRSQCESRGEIHHALAGKLVDSEDVLELGNIISKVSTGRTSDDQLSICDLTGVAVQDIQIAKAVFFALKQ